MRDYRNCITQTLDGYGPWALQLLTTKESTSSSNIIDNNNNTTTTAIESTTSSTSSGTCSTKILNALLKNELFPIIFKF